ncbi:MAG: D-glycero-beta-D-manno-heptose-7-phosphate kinase [Bdellovibrionales bacterium]|nr:D-glycero-beta-D-manno-heptose-7-phosphate kinase [Bdellovibrionales bacterium]
MKNELRLDQNKLADLRTSIRNKIGQLVHRKIVVIGDIGLDEYVVGEVRRMSPEAPVPVVDVKKQDARLGLAANVAQNVTSLGGTPWLVSVIGNDEAGMQLKSRLQASGVDPKYLVVDPQRHTTRKMRVMADHHHIVRVDYEVRNPLGPVVENQVLEQLETLIPKSDGVIIEDYAKGLLSEKTIQEIIKIAKSHDKKVTVDPNPNTPAHFYRGVDLMTPNRDETLALSQIPASSWTSEEALLLQAASKLKNQLGSPFLVVTRGKEGMTLFEPDEITHLPTYARHVFDVTGAGDTVIAALALAWSAGWSLSESCILANYAAGVVVGKVGSVPCHVNELLHYMEHFSDKNPSS